MLLNFTYNLSHSSGVEDLVVVNRKPLNVIEVSHIKSRNLKENVQKKGYHIIIVKLIIYNIFIDVMN